MNLRRTATVALAATLSLYSIAGVPVTASAVTSDELQSQLDEANARLDDIYGRATELNEQLNGTKVQLDETNAAISQAESDIADKQDELSAAQDVLAARTSADYKAGGPSLVSIVLGSTDFQDLLTRITYASKAASADAQAIGDVKDLKDSLEQRKGELVQQQAEQQQLLSDQEQQQADLDAQVKSAQDYVDSLDAQVRQKMEEERAAAAAEAQRQAEQQMQQQAQDNAQGGDSAAPSAPGSNGTTNAGGGSTGSGQTQSQPKPSSPSAPSGNQGSGGSGSGGGAASGDSGLSSSERQTIVNAALSMVGGSYVWGANNPSARQFDCSGLVQYCYSLVGISLDHYSESQGAYCTKAATTANARPGDIVWRSGHVGIYIGNGQTVEAHSPAEGIGYGSLSRFSRVGSPLA